MKKIYMLEEKEVIDARDILKKYHDNAWRSGLCGDREWSDIYRQKEAAVREVLEVLHLIKKEA